MSRPPEVQRRIEEIAAELGMLLYGPDGAPTWGTKFDALEDQACEVGDAMAQALLSQALQKQADRCVDAVACGLCGRDGPATDMEPRLVQTRRGEVNWLEPKHYCRKCRRDFFPSES